MQISEAQGNPGRGGAWPPSAPLPVVAGDRWVNDRRHDECLATQMEGAGVGAGAPDRSEQGTDQEKLGIMASTLATYGWLSPSTPYRCMFCSPS